MAEERVATSNEKEIAVHWQEEPYYTPSTAFIAKANMTDASVYERFSLEHFPECFKELGDMLDWYKYWGTTLDTSRAPFWRWFVGGRLNACYNCVDRHLAQHRNRTAIHFVPEPEDEPIQHITYQELWVRVNELAAYLRDFAGLKRGDRVTVHMPMVPELPITMLACARIGVIHSVVFGGFSGKAAADRVVDSGSQVLITMDGYYRSGSLLDHKQKADIAFNEARNQGTTLQKVLVWQRFPGKYSSPSPLIEGRDHIINDRLKEYRGQRVEPEQMNADDTLLLMYSSGTTGKPKGAQHSTAGYLAWVTMTSKWILDIHREDVYWCMADIGWITGQSYIVYGPLSLGTATVIYEGVPGYPDAGRPWRIAEELGVNIFHTSPTAIRGLRKAAPELPLQYHHHFKLMCTVGEPIEPEVWKWYYNVVGKGEAVIVDTWWQTENGGHLCSTVPALGKMKPGSAGPGVPGIHPIIYDDDGNPVPPGERRAGNICIQNPWPGLMLSVWGDPDRYVSTFYARYNKNPNSKDWRDWPFVGWDASVQSSDGYFRLMGRIYDVINVAGHRLGTKELESAALTVPEVAEAAVVPVSDEIKGVLPEVYVALKPGYAEDGMAAKVEQAIVTEIGPIARPRKVIIVPDMPKTRSGKIMRRVLAALSNRRDLGDISTLANPEVVEQLQHLS